MVLAMAPAGIAEMVLTGKVLGLDSTMIAGFQLMRIIIVLIWCRTALILFRRVADWTYGKPPDAQIDDNTFGVVLARPLDFGHDDGCYPVC